MAKLTLCCVGGVGRTAPEQIEEPIEGWEVFVAMDEERAACGAHIVARAEVNVLE
ncbi:MAG: hypothetical protein ABI024_05850 [Vicinamibacterales bacterium]